VFIQCKSQITIFNFITKQILQRSLDWLNSWESNLEAGKIESQDFLIKSTSEGLRVTLTSSIDFSDYLRDKYNFNYLLTEKVNQDSLEVM